MSVGAYVEQVDRLLAGAQSLFAGVEDGGCVGGGAERRAAAAPPDEGSGVGAAVAGSVTRFGAAQARAEAALADADRAVAAHRALVREAGVTAARIRQTAAAQAAAVGREPASPEAVVALVRAMDARLAQMQDHVAATRAALAQGAAQLRSAAADLAALRP